MSHRFQEAYPSVYGFVFINYAKFRGTIQRLTGNPRLSPEAAVKIINRHYTQTAADGDFRLLDGQKNPVDTLEQAETLRMRTGLMDKDYRSIWLTAVRDRVPSDRERAPFTAVWMEAAEEDASSGHRLLGKYPTLHGFVFLYTRFLLENLKENADADLTGVEDWRKAVSVMTRTYRGLRDEEIRVTCKGESCGEEDADEICFPTGFFTADAPRRPVIIHCERGDAGKDHPWCLHFFAAESGEGQGMPAVEQAVAEATPEQKERGRKELGFWERLTRAVGGLFKK